MIKRGRLPIKGRINNFEDLDLSFLALLLLQALLNPTEQYEKQNQTQTNNNKKAMSQE